MIFTRVCRRGKTFFSDLDTCPDNSREIPVTPVLHPKYQPYGSIPISFFYPHFSVLSPFQFPLSVSLSPNRFQRFIHTPFSENGFSGDFFWGGRRSPPLATPLHRNNIYQYYFYAITPPKARPTRSLLMQEKLAFQIARCVHTRIATSMNLCSTFVNSSVLYL